MNPFSERYNPEGELALVREAQEGSQKALAKLVKLHQRFIYNVALKFVRDPDEAADLSQALEPGYIK
jgi:DNA-directed RNA polymerase specialized sigma24 family protein